MKRGRVAIVQRRLTHYRVPLFERLRERLAADDVGLRVLHGEADPTDAQRDDDGSLDWAQQLPVRRWPGTTALTMPLAATTRDCQLLVLPQENRLLSNLPLLLRPLPTQRLAFWGHGANLQSAAPDGWRERVKRHLLTRVDWWFAYSSLTAERVQAAGYPAARVTVLDNSIDTRALRQRVQQARGLSRDVLRQRLGLPPASAGTRSVVYIGSWTADKRLPTLVQALALLRAREPAAELLLAGAGPLRAALHAARVDGITLLGPAHGPDKAALLALADVLVQPGSLGLGVLDAFAAGVPLVATRAALGRSPESAYLEDGRNALLCDSDPESLADALQGLLADGALAQRLAAEAQRSAGHFSIEAMTERFAQGLLQALQAPPYVQRSARRSFSYW